MKTEPRVCKQCGIEFQALARNVAMGFGIFCSRSCNARYHHTGERNVRWWKGGISKDPGYYNDHARKDKRKLLARKAVSNAIISGSLKSAPCVVCGNKRSHAHHEDYDNRLDVIWLCALHHKAVHYGKLDVNNFTKVDSREEEKTVIEITYP